jgi:hypothetical protein
MQNPGLTSLDNGLKHIIKEHVIDISLIIIDLWII